MTGARRRGLLCALAVALLAPACSLPFTTSAGSGGRPAEQPSGPARAALVRGVYGHDSSYEPALPNTTGFAVMRRTGFGVVQAGPYREGLDALEAAGLRAMVWLGSYDNRTCAFERDAAWVRRQVSAIAGHPAIYAYYIGDEPLVGRCPHAPDDLRGRTSLVHQLDRQARTFTVIQAWDPVRNAVPYPLWAGSGAVDIWGFDVYPCKRSPYRCDLEAIDQARALIEELGFSPYLAVLQDFQDCYYGLPTNADLHAQFARWRQSRMAGYLVFSWDYVSAEPGCAQYAAQLERVPGNVQALACENALSSGDRPADPDCARTAAPAAAVPPGA